MSVPCLEFSGISKAYGALRANDDLSFRVRSGRIHALIGENGAGKSTLMKILFGLERADVGHILLDGKKISIASPRDAKQHGVGMIHQHFKLALSLTALDHILLEDAKDSPLRKLDRKGWLKRLNELSERFQMPVPWTERIDRLPVGIQQRIEILKLLAFNARILILDEPTAVLTPKEIEQFLARLKQLKAAGKTIILITHKLKEVLAVADDVTVLKHGRLVHTGELLDETAQSLASKMVGAEFKPQDLRRIPVSGEVVLKVNDLSGQKDGRSVLEQIRFQLRSGEILGIAGVEGNGQADLIRALVIPQECKTALTGQIEFLGENILNLSNSKIRRKGLGLIPEDRLKQAVIPALTAEENYKLGRISVSKNELSRSIHDFDVKPQSPTLSFSRFSGGNQQKLVVARELGAAPKLLIAAQPTRGVDIGAIEIIHSRLMQARNQGMAILLISSELEELLRLSDRLLVMCRGRLTAEMPREHFDLNELGRLMGGAE